MSRIDLQSRTPGVTSIRRTTTTSYAPAVPWLPLILAALLVPLLLAALVTLTGFGQRDSIQDDLEARGGQALAAAGVSGATVTFSGRDATISGVPAGQEEAARQAVLGIEGVRVASVDGSGLGALVGALSGSSGDRSVTLDGETVPLTGSVGSAQERDAAEAAAADAAPGSSVDNQLTVAAKPAAPVDKKAVQRKIDGIIANRPITFEPDSATLTTAGAATVREISRVVKSARTVDIEVGGHVARTPGSATTAKRLSDQRAGTVKALLGRLGISADRVTAKGFGDSKPIADSSTTEGQAANRRVEIVVL